AAALAGSIQLERSYSRTASQRSPNNCSAHPLSVAPARPGATPWGRPGTSKKAPGAERRGQSSHDLPTRKAPNPANRGFGAFGSGGYRDRTDDFRLAKPALSQLS